MPQLSNNSKSLASGLLQEGNTVCWKEIFVVVFQTSCQQQLLPVSSSHSAENMSVEGRQAGRPSVARQEFQEAQCTLQKSGQFQVAPACLPSRHARPLAPACEVELTPTEDTQLRWKRAGSQGMGKQSGQHNGHGFSYSTCNCFGGSQKQMFRNSLLPTPYYLCMASQGASFKA